LPKGTWMISMKIEDDKVWKDAKDGKYKGFSIEGYFADKLEMSIQEAEAENLINEIINILNNGK
jgi:hypothetical protein